MEQDSFAAVDVALAERGTPIYGSEADSEQVSFGRWVAAMASGNVSQAWEINLRDHHHWPSVYTLYNEALAPFEELMVYGLHGLADIVQMMQYANRLQGLAKRVTYVVPASLQPLMKHFWAVEHVIRLADPTPVITNQNSVETLELPFVFRTIQSDFPIATHYLDRTGELQGRFASNFPRVARKLRVGISWQGSTWDTDRWIPTQELLPLFKLHNVEFWRLQGSAAGTDLTFQSDDRQDLGIEGTVGMMANLDLILSIDGLSAHLAGALGKPVWIALKHDRDWRWLDREARTPWYPTALLFRQPRPGDWHAVVASMVPRLKMLGEIARAGAEEALRSAVADTR